MVQELDIITIGECLIELSSNESLHYTDTLTKYYGGDTLTTAVAASRLGSKVGFITKVGNDFFKDFLIESWKNENLDISQVKISEEYNGMYLIARPQNGRLKELSYYRKKTAATKLSIDDVSEEYVKSAKIIYATGIVQSLSLYLKEAIKKTFEYAKKESLIVAYDPNFNPLLMKKEDALAFLDDVVSNVDVLFLNSKSDAEELLELTSVDKIIKHFWDLGVGTVVVKSIEKGGYYTGYNGDIVFTKLFVTENIIDSTGAGDAFNGAFLHAISHGATVIEATKLASVVSGLQTQNIGAIKSIPNKELVISKLNEVENS